MTRQYKHYSIIYAYTILHSYVKMVNINYRIVPLLLLHELLRILMSLGFKGLRGDAVGWGTALQAGRSRVRLT